jgi:hypothetical protein
MHIRTQAIGLMPEIENNCIQDLATCRNPEVKGEVRRDFSKFRISKNTLDKKGIVESIRRADRCE